MSFCYKISYKSFYDYIFMNGKIIAMNRKRIILLQTHLYCSCFYSRVLTNFLFYLLFIEKFMEIYLFYLFIYQISKKYRKVQFLNLNFSIFYLFY